MFTFEVQVYLLQYISKLLKAMLDAENHKNSKHKS